MADHPSYLTSLIGGGIAGTTVDIALFPLDTLKTRFQSSIGFLKAGGFRGVYKGLSITAVGSAPGAALFFSTYERTKQLVINENKVNPAIAHMAAASVGELVACVVRVPTEVIKQKMQTSVYKTARYALVHTVSTTGMSGLYSGFGITILRDIPFSLIQFPLYEQLKYRFAKYFKRSPTSYEAAMCGSISGAVAAAITTPLDVMKTRLMLGSDEYGVPYRNIVETAQRLYIEGTRKRSAGGSVIKVFFAGVSPRVMWISIGGFFFFGAYEQSLYLISPLLNSY